MLTYFRNSQSILYTIDRIVAFGLVSSVLCGFAIAYWHMVANRNFIDKRFDEVSQSVGQSLQRKFQTYEYGLRGARGAVVAAGNDLSRDRFRQYARTRDLDVEFPGSKGFGYIKIVQPAFADLFVKEARKDGNPDFKITQLGDQHGEMYVIQYIEPEEPNMAAVGLDISSEARRREAALTAIEQGQATLTAPITLVQAFGKTARSFLLLLPIYSPEQPIDTPEQRRTAAIGLAYTPLLIDDVLASAHFLSDEFVLIIYDQHSGDSKPLYSTENVEDAGRSAVSKQVDISLYGRDLKIVLYPRAPFIHHLQLISPAISGSAALLIGLLLTSVLHLHFSGLRKREFAWRERARLASIVAESSEAIIGKTLNGEITDWNPAAEQLFGYTAAEAVGHRLGDLIVPPHLIPERDHALKQMVESGDCVRLTTKRQSRTGRILDMVVNFSPIRSETGDIVGIGTSARDITSYVDAQEELRRLNSSLEEKVAARTAELEASTVLQRAILEYSGYAVIATTTAGIVSVFNPAAEQMLGYCADEVVGRMNAGMFHDSIELEERAQKLSEQLGRTVRPEVTVVALFAKYRSADSIWTYITKSGDRIPVRLKISKLVAADGRPLGLLAIGTDQTEQMRHEAELQAAKETAEQAADAKSEFLASMSHELRTPLNSIIGFSQLIMESRANNDSQVQRHSELIHHASTTLLSIVNDILDVSKLDADRFELDCRRFSIRPLFENTVALLRAQADGKGLSLELKISPSVPESLVGDDHRIRQVVLNLVANALKFTGRGSVTVEVRAIAASSETYRLHVSVRDTGIGVAEDARSRIFKRFSQVDSGTARTYGGTGLGLSICKRLIELMDGAIDFNSSEGEGSEFWFTIVLPIADPGSSTVREDLPEIEPIRDRHSVILLVEDNLLNQELASSIIKKWGHQVDIVSDGVEAIEAVREKQYDLVLMDVQMPVMDGVEATTRIRALGERYASLPIIAMTAAVLQNQIEQFKRAGMSDHIGKPFDPQALRKIINFWSTASVEDPGIELAPTQCAIENAEITDLGDTNGRDSVALNALVEMIGHDKTEQLLQKFAADLGRRFQTLDDLDALGADAHTISSSAGMLGFNSLSARARELEHACVTRIQLEDCRRAFLIARAEVQLILKAGEHNGTVLTSSH